MWVLEAWHLHSRDTNVCSNVWWANLWDDTVAAKAIHDHSNVSIFWAFDKVFYEFRSKQSAISRTQIEMLETTKKERRLKVKSRGKRRNNDMEKKLYAKVTRAITCGPRLWTIARVSRTRTRKEAKWKRENISPKIILVFHCFHSFTRLWRLRVSCDGRI